MPTRALKVAVLLLFAAPLVFLRSAWAETTSPVRVAVLRLVVEGDAARELKDDVAGSLTVGLVAAGYEVIPDELLRRLLAGTPELTDCMTRECLARIADKVDATHFVRARVERIGAQYSVEVELLTAPPEQELITRIEDSCAVCTVKEANALVARVASALASTRATPVVTVPARGPPAASLRQSSVWKWVSAGAAVVALGAGVGLIAMDGRGTNCPGAPGDVCRDLYDTLAAGLVTTGGGLALGGVTTYLFVRETRAKNSTAAVVPVAGGAAVVVMGQF